MEKAILARVDALGKNRVGRDETGNFRNLSIHNPFKRSRSSSVISFLKCQVQPQRPQKRSRLRDGMSSLGHKPAV